MRFTYQRDVLEQSTRFMFFERGEEVIVRDTLSDLNYVREQILSVMALKRKELIACGCAQCLEELS